MDSNGDGVGDLPGITAKLDELKYLGVNVLWLCPMYKSPHDDNGYDISDYQDIHPEFGTMAEFDHLLEQAHVRGMKILIDLVINHTSDEHPWFLESRKSKTNEKRDWYIWRDGKEHKEPNNWESIFGGSAWEYSATTGQYYMHLFSVKQPDLNWENHEMRSAVYQMIRWWLDKGIDGFRIDAISHIKKEPGLKDIDNPGKLRFAPSFSKHMNVDGIHDYIEELCEETFRKYDIMTVGEANGVPVEQADRWVSESQRKFNMLFQFEHLSLWDTDPSHRMDLEKVKSAFTRWQKGLEGHGWNALYLENHDIPRILSKWGDVEFFWRESATCFATMYFLMQGTPFIYQGQEIGMTNTQFSGADDFNDVWAKRTFAENRRQGVSDEVTLRRLSATSRDNARTPMQWSDEANAGFTTGRPWLKVNPNYTRINWQSQKGQAGSVLEHYRHLIHLRQSDSDLVYGRYQLIEDKNPQVFSYLRRGENSDYLIVCNMTAKPALFRRAEKDLSEKKIVSQNWPVEAHAGAGLVHLRPFEARVYKIR